jgi:hypothetical protein
MRGIHQFSARMIDYAERLSDVADAAQGRNHQRAGSATRWLLLPASGAALYAFVKSESFSRQAKDVIGDAKTRAAELPEELIGLVRQTAAGGTTRNGSTQSRSQSRPAAQKKPSARRRSAARKPAASKR